MASSGPSARAAPETAVVARERTDRKWRGDGRPAAGVRGARAAPRREVVRAGGSADDPGRRPGLGPDARQPSRRDGGGPRRGPRERLPIVSVVAGDLAGRAAGDPRPCRPAPSRPSRGARRPADDGRGQDPHGIARRGGLRRRHPRVLRRRGLPCRREGAALGGRDALPRAPGAGRAGRSVHPLELPDGRPRAQGRRGPRRRLHGRAETGRGDARLGARASRTPSPTPDSPEAC